MSGSILQSGRMSPITISLQRINHHRLVKHVVYKHNISHGIIRSLIVAQSSGHSANSETEASSSSLVSVSTEDATSTIPSDISPGAQVSEEEQEQEQKQDTNEVTQGFDGNLQMNSVGIIGRGRTFVNANPVAGYSLVGVAGFLSVTFVIAVIKSTAKGFTKQGKRTRTVQKNKLVIDELNRYLPQNRDQLQGNSITGIRLRTGFTPVEIFRKYLWYLLRERKFDHEALADLIELKSCLNLSDVEVADALKERASRIFEKYGTIMLDTSGMSPAGIERKATSRALFSKMLYLVECDDLLMPGGESRDTVDLRDIFGATEDDVGRLRIASLYEVDLDSLMASTEKETTTTTTDEEEEEDTT